MPNGSDDEEVAMVVSASKKFNVKLMFGGLRGVIWCNSTHCYLLQFVGEKMHVFSRMIVKVQWKVLK